jgi:uncharacterized membrane protein
MRSARRLAMLVVLAGCGGEPLFGPPTQSVCPEGSTLTYESFGKPFMETYCTSCHSSELSGTMRNGAPRFHDFDTLVGIRAVANHIDETTAAGPNATNEGMPPEAPFPTLEERQQLGEWIACGMP